MEEKNYPIIIKKKNSFMLMAVIAEFFVALVYGIIYGFTNLLFVCFLFVAIITLLSVWVEYSRDIYLKENKIEFYSNKDLLKKIKYSSIVSLDVEHGEEAKDKKKEFFTIKYNETSTKKSKNKEPKIKKYYLSSSWYTANDFKMIKDIIKSKNTNVKIDENLKKYTKEK
ncbi:MAG: hypothetical protein ACI398_08730 [Clostridium sp.]